MISPFRLWARGSRRHSALAAHAADFVGNAVDVLGFAEAVGVGRRTCFLVRLGLDGMERDGGLGIWLLDVGGLEVAETLAVGDGSRWMVWFTDVAGHSVSRCSLILLFMSI